MVLPFFRNAVFDEPSFFDEGPKIRATSTILTSSIGNSDVDPYLQGVEITTERKYASGFVKIYSGEQGHSILVSVIGQDADFSNNVSYVEPVSSSNVFRDSGLTLNGAIEPFMIRDSITFKSSDTSHAVKASLGSGNEFASGCDVVVTEFQNNPDHLDQPFVDSYRLNSFENGGSDSFDMDGRTRSFDLVLDRPFIDRRSQTIDGLTVDNLASYVSSSVYEITTEIHATAGWTFDSTKGSDSIAFGGMNRS